MKIENIRNACTGCTACKTICPQQCITMNLDDEGFYFPQIDHNKCITCGICDDTCPCLNPKKYEPSKTSYYGWHKDEEKRHASSSGGAFIALADEIICRDGVVYGAAFDTNRRKLHHISSDAVPITNLQKSKYIESDLEDTFNEIQKHLNNSRCVLFCGTPCEVDGLKKAVHDPNNLLITCDFICHGVPSSAFFREHLSHIVSKNEQLLEIDFRPKDRGWSSIALRIKTKRKSKIKTRTRYYPFDSYYYGFMVKNAFLRRSCYECRYRQVHSSDITIADFWGFKNYDTTLNDEKGLSLIVANNDKGKKLVKEITKDFNLYRIDNKYSDYAYAPKDYSIAYKERKKFYILAHKLGFEKAAKRTYMSDAPYRYMVYIFKKAIKKMIGRS